MYERFVDEVFDELAEECDAGYDEDLFAEVGFEGDEFEKFLDDVVDESLEEFSAPRQVATCFVPVTGEELPDGAAAAVSHCIVGGRCGG